MLVFVCLCLCLCLCVCVFVRELLGLKGCKTLKLEFWPEQCLRPGCAALEHRLLQTGLNKLILNEIKVSLEPF